MSRRNRILIGAAAVGVAAAGVLWWVQHRAAHQRQTPDWTDPDQPPEGTAGMPTSGPGSAAWCASRPPLPALRAGARVIREYAPTLADDPESLVR